MHVEEDLYSPKLTYGQNPSVEILLHIFPPPGSRLDGTQAYGYAMEWLATHEKSVPKVTKFQRLTGVKTDPVAGSDGASFDVTLSFSKFKSKITTFHMDTNGETAKRTFGLTVAAAGRLATFSREIEDNPRTKVFETGTELVTIPAAIPDFFGGINFQNGEFQGIDIPVPGASFSITAVYPFTFLTQEWTNVLTLYRGCTNNADFLFWAAGEVMFTGASIDMEEDLTLKGERRFLWRVTFQFKASPNVTGLTNNGTLLPISKRGWDTYWVYSVSKPDPASQRVVQQPVAHYSVQVCPSVDFSALSIPDFRLQEQG